MREIKFRAWDKKEKKIVYFGSFFSIDDMNSCGLIFHPRLSDDHRQGTAKDFVLMQFTGLKDKNGKEIFEGDIILIKTGTLTFKKETKCEVEFYRGSFIARGEPLSNWIDVEIIGNKFENPELLK